MVRRRMGEVGTCGRGHALVGGALAKEAKLEAELAPSVGGTICAGGNLGCFAGQSRPVAGLLLARPGAQNKRDKISGS